MRIVTRGRCSLARSSEFRIGVATASGTAADLLLLLWHRLGADDPAVAWDGDSGLARSVLTAALVP